MRRVHGLVPDDRDHVQASRQSAAACPRRPRRSHLRVELLRDPVFAGIPPKFLLWQQGLVVRRQLRRGQAVCRKGEPGNTAFIIKSGKLEVVVPLQGVRSSNGVFGEMLGLGRSPVFRSS